MNWLSDVTMHLCFMHPVTSENQFHRRTKFTCFEFVLVVFSVPSCTVHKSSCKKKKKKKKAVRGGKTLSDFIHIIAKKSRTDKKTLPWCDQTPKCSTARTDLRLLSKYSVYTRYEGLIITRLSCAIHSCIVESHDLWHLPVHLRQLVGQWCTVPCGGKTCPEQKKIRVYETTSKQRPLNYAISMSHVISRKKAAWLGGETTSARNLWPSWGFA